MSKENETRPKIVAFLQNPWFQPGTAEKHVLMYRDNQDFHRRVLAMSMTGRRLMSAFGGLYDHIHWDNTSWQPANTAPGRIPPDFEHMAKVLKMHEDWGLILTFGNQAQEAVRYFLNPFNEYNVEISDLRTRVMSCHHPNARHRTQEDLNCFAARVWEQVKKVA